MFKARPAQKTVIDYTGGRMGVAAVPGSGKTQTLSFLAARLIHDGRIQEGQEVLVVTLTNSAVGNFQSRIDQFIHQFGMIRGIGYRVRTLHGLAHDIVRERPDLVGLPSQFNIIDERESGRMLESSVRDWLLAHPEIEERYYSPDQRNRNFNRWIDLMVEINQAFIKKAKDLQMDPLEIRARMNAASFDHLLLVMGCDIYSDYNRKISLREGVDFDDLIRYALVALRTDPDYLARLRLRWPYVLEDEAQDSSHLQQEILNLITNDGGNWVRVGDPNQAIYETFTTADPQLLRDFIAAEGVQSTLLPNAGRSTRTIIDMANHLVNWTVHEHPVPALHDALFEAYIEETPLGDPQPNPPDELTKIRIYPPTKRISSEREIALVVEFIKHWVSQEGHEQQTAAVLVPTNAHGDHVIAELKSAGLPFVELLRNTAETRRTAKQLEAVLTALSRPTDPRQLQRAYVALREPELATEEGEHGQIEETARLLHTCQRVEQFLYPQGGADWLAALLPQLEEGVHEELRWLRDHLRRWQAAVLLPIDQLILTIAADLYEQPADLALSHKFAQMLEFYARSNRSWSLPDFAAQLNEIASSQRGFSGLSASDTAFDPEAHHGKVVVATMHKAKGLEWDIVFLLSVSNYDFPSLDPFDQYVSEKWFIRDQLNLQEEMLSKLTALIEGDEQALTQPEGVATLQARQGIAEERLRLLYVGITRARKELNLLWNIGRMEKNQPARAYLELDAWWKERNHDPAA